MFMLVSSTKAGRTKYETFQFDNDDLTTAQVFVSLYMLPLQASEPVTYWV